MRILPRSWRTEGVASAAEAEAVLDAVEVKVLACSDGLEGETGLMFLARTRDVWPRLRRVLFVDQLDPDFFFHAMREVRLFDYLPKPVVPDQFATVAARARTQYDALIRTSAGNARVPPRPASEADRPQADAGIPGGPLVGGSGPRDAVIFLTAFLLGAISIILGLLVLYVIKSAAGWDFFPFIHLRDLFQG